LLPPLGSLRFCFRAAHGGPPAESAGFAPLGRPAVLPSGPSPGPRVALPGGRSMAHGPHQITQFRPRRISRSSMRALLFFAIRHAPGVHAAAPPSAVALMAARVVASIASV